MQIFNLNTLKKPMILKTTAVWNAIVRKMIAIILKLEDNTYE